MSHTHRYLIEPQGTREGGMSRGRCLNTNGCDERYRIMSNVLENGIGWIGLDYAKRESVARGGNRSRANQKARAKAKRA
tara:strand:+ start:499 stop:735 length:237 start_codon:yes stop_codon:yes gene_type:complete